VQKGREVLALMRAGAIRGLSIGYQAIKDAMVNGVREISEIRLFEVSAVPFPMDLGAQVTSVKSLDQITRAAAEFKHFRESFNKKWTPRWIQH
jgi:HK97 family phage prohead protease